MSPKCPECRAPLVILELEGIEVDHCLACAGTWLDPGELERLTSAAGAAPGPLRSAIQSEIHGRKSGRRCPRCDRHLRSVALEGPSRVEVDRCEGGHGMWLDHGEMEAVISSFHEGEAGVVARFFAELLHDELGSKGRERPGE